MADPRDSTPYSTASPFLGPKEAWISNDYDGERIAAYKFYQDLYWSEDQVLQLIRRNEDGRGVYVPKPKVIADTTAHYLLKGLQIGVTDPEKNRELQTFIDNFIKRERFHSRFQVAKLAGVTRGDWVFHLTANPTKPEGSRLSLNSIDPACYFPQFDTDDLEKRTGAKIVEQSVHPDDPTKVVLKVLHYWQEYDLDGNLVAPTVWREEALFEVKDWDIPSKAVKVRQLLQPSPLPPDIPAIPLYHFKNAEWDGFDFGNSELKGYERIFQAIDQAISDEEIALALVGLGVYATDAGRPKVNGVEQDWIVAPGTVWEMPGATMVKRLEGISTVTPVLDHVRYLEDVLMEASATSKIAVGEVDVQTAESGIALALKFLPTLAKIEYRDVAGVEVLTQMWYDWKFWVKAYEGQDYTEIDINIELGDKLPLDRSKRIDELNNMFDRKVISAKYYRQEMTSLGYEFPDDIAQEIIDEEIARAEAMMATQQQQFGGGDDDEEGVPGPGGRLQGAGDTLPRTNNSNNRDRVNESNGSEASS